MLIEVIWLIWCFNLFMIGMLIGFIVGQHSVWKELRRKRDIVIDNWIYSAGKLSPIDLDQFLRSIKK